MKSARALSGLFLAIALIATIPGVAKAADDPLPSWNDVSVKMAVVDFVARVTTEGGRISWRRLNVLPNSTTTARYGRSNRSIFNFSLRWISV